MYSNQLCNFLCRKLSIIHIITKNKNCKDHSFDKTVVTSFFHVFKSENTKNRLFWKKKNKILDKFQWSHEKCSYFPIQRLECSCFFAYVLKMFLLLKKNKLLCSYKHGSYKKKRVFPKNGWDMTVWSDVIKRKNAKNGCFLVFPEKIWYKYRSQQLEFNVGGDSWCKRQG